MYRLVFGLVTEHAGGDDAQRFVIVGLFFEFGESPELPACAIAVQAGAFFDDAEVFVGIGTVNAMAQ
jgi:hypothetical protein